LVAAQQAVGAHLLSSEVPELQRAAQTCIDLLEQGVVSGERRLLHGDPKPDNFVLSSRGWLAIDPIPMFGDPTFEVSRYLSVPRAGLQAADRLQPLADALEIEPRSLARMLYVVLCHALAWHVAERDEEMVEERVGGLDSIRDLLDT
jgi:streptomycin 6-kinase